MVAQVLFQGVHDHLEGSSSVVIDQVLHILQEEESRAAMSKDAHNVKEKSALGFATEAMWLVEGVLLGNAGEGERLARKPGKQHIVRRNLIRLYLGDVASQRVIVAIICFVGGLAEAVPLRREDTLTSNRLEPLSKAANARKTGR